MGGRKEKGILSMIGRDFNARTGEEKDGIMLEGKIVKMKKESEDEGKRNRNLKDRKMNRKEKLLMEFLEEREILNGCTIGDEEGEFTFTGGKGNTVIDYVLEDEEMRERVINLKIGERTDSDHQPVVMRIEKDNRNRRRERRRNRERMRKGIWNEERKEVYRNKMIELEEGGLRIEGKKWKRE